MQIDSGPQSVRTGVLSRGKAAGDEVSHSRPSTAEGMSGIAPPICLQDADRSNFTSYKGIEVTTETECDVRVLHGHWCLH